MNKYLSYWESKNKELASQIEKTKRLRKYLGESLNESTKTRLEIKKQTNKEERKERAS